MSVYRRLFDYAGVFPPASLPLAEAIDHYRDLKAGGDGWLVGPLLVRAGQLEADLPLKSLRAALASIGSCSIDEPAGYLRDLGVGPVAAT